MKTKEEVYGINVFRGVGWLVVAIAGAWLIGSGKLTEYGMNEYTARWLGVLFKAGSGTWVGYRISRDVLKIDPSVAISGSVPFALMHIARALIIGLMIFAVTQGT